MTDEFSIFNINRYIICLLRLEFLHGMGGVGHHSSGHHSAHHQLMEGLRDLPPPRGIVGGGVMEHLHRDFGHSRGAADYQREMPGMGHRGGDEHLRGFNHGGFGGHNQHGGLGGVGGGQLPHPSHHQHPAHHGLHHSNPGVIQHAATAALMARMASHFEAEKAN